MYFAYGSESIVSYVMNRTLKGTYALKDSYSAEGEEIRSVQNNVNKDIILLKGKAAYLKKNVDEYPQTWLIWRSGPNPSLQLPRIKSKPRSRGHQRQKEISLR